VNTSSKIAFWRLAAVATATALFVAACGGNAAASSRTVGGGTVTFAEDPGTPPTYILPLMSSEHESNANLYQFSNFLYLPLYWFGQKGEPVLNKTLSVAHPPVFSDNNTVATVTLKHWRWSNGQPITARDVIFWMNMLSAVTDPKAPVIGTSTSPGPGWFASVPGGFPENVVKYTQTGTYSITFKMNASYNPTWFLYNELSQIYPLPQASWDKLSPGAAVGDADATAEARTALPGTSPASYVPTNPGGATTGALGVAAYLSNQANDLGAYISNPLWRVVDGPFKLTQFTSDGFAKFVPNTAYSGSDKPKVSAFEEEPFTSDTAEYDELRTGSLTIGYLPVQDLAQKAAVEKSEGYKLNAWYGFGYAYAGYNYTNPIYGPVFKQLYFRQAFQSLVNQKQYIKDFAGGIGSIDNGPVPTYPPNNPDESSLEAKGQVYPYDPAKAVKLLKDNGWTVNPGGSSFCSKPGTAAGDCGAGVKANVHANFGMLYFSGQTETTAELQAMQSTFQQKAGIDLTLTAQPFAQVIATIFNSCSYATPCSGWEIAGGDLAWTYSPDYFPTGEELFATGAGSNLGDYSNPVDDANIVATTTAPTSQAEHSALVKYQNYLARQLPVMYLPNVPLLLTMYKSGLKGLVPQDVYDILYPQDYSLKSS
jgi:peptide/nickel transport system substrate-binding protein